MGWRRQVARERREVAFSILFINPTPQACFSLGSCGHAPYAVTGQHSPSK